MLHVNGMFKWQIEMAHFALREHAVALPFGHRFQELIDGPFQIPLGSVRVVPARCGFRVEIVERRLDHAVVEEKAIDGVAVPSAALLRGLAVAVEVLAGDGDSARQAGDGEEREVYAMQAGDCTRC